MIFLVNLVTNNVGSGLYIKLSCSINQRPISNNSIIVSRSRSRSCSWYSCPTETLVDLYCYSNSTSQRTGYYRYPNGNRYSTSGQNFYYVTQESYLTVCLHGISQQSGSMNIWGIFTCEMPDAEGNIVKKSIGIYSSMPSKLTA